MCVRHKALIVFNTTEFLYEKVGNEGVNQWVGISFVLITVFIFANHDGNYVERLYYELCGKLVVRSW